MCGICGFSGTHNPQLLRRMTASIIHRGPDGEGFFEDGGRVGLGMRRLAIIDIAGGNQPIYNEDNTIAVVFNGEIYNYQELRKQLIAKGHKFATNSDTETIVHAYEEYGDECPKHFRGMFAFAIWDTRTKKLFIARDHFGIKPLYYAELNGELYFGSEIKCLLQHSPLNRGMDYSALDDYFSLVYIPAPQSIFNGIKKLPAGHFLIWKDNKTKIGQYWSVPEFSKTCIHKADAEYTEQLTELLKSSIQEQKISDVPLGVFLSGGLDSSAIVALMSKLVNVPIKTFCIGYGKRDATYNETDKASSIAKYFGCEHHEYTVEPNAMDIIPKLVGHFDEPFADSSAIPTYLVSREARNNITVALTGIGGDEVFAGYPRYLGARVSQIYEHLPMLLRQGVHRLSELVPESTKSRNLGGWIRRFAHGGTMPFAQRYISWITWMSSAQKTDLFMPSLRSYRNQSPSPFPELTKGLQTADDLFAYEFKTYLPGDLLCLSDRASMAASLELRVPFLDTRLVEYASQIPLATKTRNFTLKYLMKKMLEGVLPKETLYQSKRGFQIPIGRWINDEMRTMVDDLLSYSRLQRHGLFNPTIVQNMLAEHRSGQRNFTDQLYALLVFELWHEQYAKGMPAIVPKEPAAPLTIHPALQGKKLKKILLINLGGIGDIIMMQPIIKAIRLAYPAMHVSLLTIPRSALISHNVGGIGSIFTVPLHFRKPKLSHYFEFLQTLLLIRSLKFDVLINLREIQTTAGKWKMRLVTNLMGADVTIGRNIGGRGSFYDIAIPESEISAESEVINTSRLLKPIGIENIDPNIEYEVFSYDIKFILKEFQNLGISNKTVIGINPGAFRPSRRWPLEHWQALINKLVYVYPNVAILVTGDSSETPFANQLVVADNVIVTNGKYSFGQLAALMQKMDLYISNDTGPMHLAAAVGTKVVAIFGPGDVVRFAPSIPKDRYRIARVDSINCNRPCYAFECDAPVCLTAVTPDMVLGAVKELLPLKKPKL